MEKKIVKFPFLSQKAEEIIKKGDTVVIPYNGITLGEATALSVERMAVEADADRKEVRIRKEAGL